MSGPHGMYPGHMGVPGGMVPGYGYAMQPGMPQGFHLHAMMQQPHMYAAPSMPSVAPHAGVAAGAVGHHHTRAAAAGGAPVMAADSRMVLSDAVVMSALETNARIIEEWLMLASEGKSVGREPSKTTELHQRLNASIKMLAHLADNSGRFCSVSKADLRSVVDLSTLTEPQLAYIAPDEYITRRRSGSAGGARRSGPADPTAAGRSTRGRKQ